MGWTNEQDDYIREHYPNHLISVSDIAKHLNRNSSSVRKRAFKLGVPRGKTKSEINDYIIENYTKEKPDSIAAKFNTTVKSIYCRAARLGLCKEQEFPYSMQTTSIHEEIKNNYADESTFVLSARIGLPESTIRKIAWGYGIKKNRKKKQAKFKTSIYSTWQEYEILFIKNNYHRMTTRQIATHLGRGYNSVKGKIAHLGLSQYNLKLYTVGKFSFLYTTDYEKEEKLIYITMYNDLLNRRNRDYVGGKNKRCS